MENEEVVVPETPVEEVTASEPVETVSSETVSCSNCDGTVTDCSVCHKGAVVE